MSKFNNIVPVPLGEIRCLDGKLGTAMKPGTLVTAVSNFAGGNSKHTQSDYPNSVFTAAVAGATSGLLIVMDQEDLVLADIATARAANSHARAHVLKSGEEVTVILTAAANINAGDGLETVDGGLVQKKASATAVFSAIESATTASSGDGLRILARVL